MIIDKKEVMFMQSLIPTFKQIARSAGYYAYQQFSSSGTTWRWRDANGWSTDSSNTKFYSEEEAYKDCCIKAGLIQLME